MNRKNYRQIPLTNQMNCCPVCGEMSKHREQAVVTIYSLKKPHQYREVNAQLCECQRCGIGFASAEIFKNIRLENAGMFACGFRVTSRDKPQKVKQRIENFPFECSKSEDKAVLQTETISIEDGKFRGFPTHRLIGASYPATIYVLNEKPRQCPVCGGRVHGIDMMVPVSATLGVKSRVYFCGKHVSTIESHKLLTVLKDNPFASHLITDYTYYFKKDQKFNDFYCSGVSAPLVVILRDKENGDEMALAFQDRTGSPNDSIKVINYKSVLGRELLTEIIHHNRSNIRFSGKEYKVVCLYPIAIRACGWRFFPQKICLQKGGGYKESITDDRLELADVLFYSPKTKRYELCRATFDTKFNECFVDASLFRQFVYRYGNPGISVRIVHDDSQWESATLREESLLHVFGYTVSRKSALTEDERHEILAFAIDTGILSSRQIVLFLQALIARFKSQKYEDARIAWENDIEYVATYHANPSRFLIYE